MNFNGSGDDAIFVPTSSDIDLTGDLTLEYWNVDSNASVLNYDQEIIIMVRC